MIFKVSQRGGWIIKTDTYGELRYLRVTKGGWGQTNKFGLVKNIADATSFDHNRASAMASYAWKIISRSFKAVAVADELAAVPIMSTEL